MSTQVIRPPAETGVDPVMEWLFRHGWEDPGWGKSEVGQLTLTLVIHDLAGRFVNHATRDAIREITSKSVGEAAQRIIRK